MKAIPTIYNGRQYRSRLEARWAAMFDLMRWPYEYEPFDLDGWIPDFVLLGKGYHPKVYVEVKPAIIGRDLAMFDTDKYYSALEDAGEKSDLLLLGIGPVEETEDLLLCSGGVLGYLKEYCDGWVDGYAWLKYDKHWDFGHDSMGYDGRMFSGEDHEGACWHKNWRKLWNRAGNIVQWKAPVKHMSDYEIDVDKMANEILDEFVCDFGRAL